MSSIKSVGKVPIDEINTDQVEIVKAPYSIYTTKEKYLLLFIVAFIGLWSGISTPIYYPACKF